jgi:hypothetical protein
MKHLCRVIQRRAFVQLWTRGVNVDPRRRWPMYDHRNTQHDGPFDTDGRDDQLVVAGQQSFNVPVLVPTAHVHHTSRARHANLRLDGLPRSIECAHFQEN